MNKRVLCRNGIGNSIWKVGLIAGALVLVASGLRPANSLESHYEPEPKVKFVDGTPNPVDPAGKWYTCINRAFIVDVTAEDEDSWMNSGVERYDNDVIERISMERLGGEILALSDEPEVDEENDYYGARLQWTTEESGNYPVIFRAKDKGGLSPGNSNDPAADEESDPKTITVFEVTVYVDSGLPGTAWDKNIPLNTTSASNATVSVDIDPDCDTAVDVFLDSMEHADFDGKIFARLIETQTTTLYGTSPGNYTLTPRFRGEVCGDTVQGIVFKLVIGQADPESVGHSLPNGSTGDYWVAHDAAEEYIMAAADLDVEREGWFETSPPGAYGLYVKATVRSSQKFVDPNAGFPDWGVYIFDELRTPGEDGIDRDLSYGLVEVTQEQTAHEGTWSSFACQVKCKGPTDSAWKECTKTQIDTKSSDIGGIGRIHTKSCAQLRFVDSDLNHFKVGDSSSSIEARARASCSGAYHSSWAEYSRAYVKFDEEDGIVKFEIVGELELTADPSP